MKNKDLISIQEISKKELADLLYLANRIKIKPQKYISALTGKTLALLFNKPSTRTRVSFEAGMQQLGGNTIFMTEREMQIGRGESIADTAKVLSRYIQAIVIRTFAHNTIKEFAENASIPVINGLTDLLHPCQILADILTIKEKKNRLQDINLAYIGDGANNIANSWLLAAAKTGINLKIATPLPYQPKAEILEQAQAEIRNQKNGTIEITADPQAAARNADILYTDVWISMGQDKQREEKLIHFKPYQINQKLLEQAKPDALVMHCLPAHPGKEITKEVLYSPQSVIFDQAENRLHLQKALLLTLLT